jgi:fatty acid synthase
MNIHRLIYWLLEMVFMSLMLSVVVTVIPVHVYKELSIIQSAGVEFRGLKTSTVSRHKPLSKPVLQKYVLTPNIEPAHLDLHTALRVCMQITMENKPVTQVKVVELHNPGWMLLAPAVALILADKPLSEASKTVWNAASLKLQSSHILSIIHCLC